MEHELGSAALRLTEVTASARNLPPCSKGSAEATEVPVETIVAEDPSIPVGEATEVVPEVVSVGTEPAARFAELKAKLQEHGLSAEESTEMSRIDPDKVSPEEASVKIGRAHV